MNFIYTNQIWTLVDPPEGIKPIKYKWIFKKDIDIEVIYKFTKLY